MKGASTRIVQADHLIESLDSGSRIHLREKRLEGLRPKAAGILLCVHGQSIPSPVAFDFPVPGYSWMDFVASRGFDVFALSLRGFGLSKRPWEMRETPEGKRPAVRAKESLLDVEAAVRFILARRKVEHVNLLGWAQGTMLVAAFAAKQPQRVGRLVLCSPLYLCDDPEEFKLFEDPKRPGNLNPVFFKNSWRWVTEKGQFHNWNRLIPRGRHSSYREERSVRAYWREQLRYDPEGAKRRPPGVRVPNGLMVDHYDRTQGKAFFNAAKVRSPVLLIRAEHDRVSKDAEAQTLFRALKASLDKRYVVIGDATHFAQFEKRRNALFQETQSFLES